MTLAVGAFLGVAGQVDACDVMVVPNFGPAQAAKEALRTVRAGTVRRVGKLVIDPLRHVAGVQVVPASGVIGDDLGPGSDV